MGLSHGHVSTALATSTSCWTLDFQRYYLPLLPLTRSSNPKLGPVASDMLVWNHFCPSHAVLKKHCGPTPL